MRHFIAFAALSTILFSFALIAGPYGGSPIGPGVSERNGIKLQWETGSQDYFTMFKTLLWNPDPANDMGGANPSADKCLTQSTFTVNPGDLPEDAYVEAAYLIWATAIDPDKVFGIADNSVTLAYTQKDGYADETREITVDGHSVTDKTNQDFEFQAIYLSAQDTGSDNVGYFTYRAEITDFFTSVHTKAREAGAPSDGTALIGSYTLSNMECSEHAYYATNAYNGSNSIMVGGWTVLLIYRSERITPKKIYIYHGFDMYNMQEIDLTVSGFEFPEKPVVRLTLMVNEGDPGLAFASHTACGGGMFGGACPPEGLQVKGQTAAQWAPLFDKCNPLKDKDSQGSAFVYTEMYNCISSFYGWDDTEPTCIGGDPNTPDPVKLEYSMDVDAMLLNGEFFPFDQHFKKNDTSFMLKIGANGDMIFTNLLVLSVDTRASKYDIPVSPQTPSGREKHYCSCSPVTDAVCFDRPFYYTVKIQNWGDEWGEDVTVQDALPPQVDYIAGTTEMATEFDANGNGTNWTPIEDAAGGAFPLSTARKVADVLYYCDRTTMTCTDTILLRFKVQPKNGLAKNAVIENTAVINDIANIPYRSNTTVPLRLRSGNCPSVAECPEPPKALCGGEGTGVSECQNDNDCGAGKKCDNGSCVVDPDKTATDTVVEFAIGRNSPANGSAIVVHSPATGLTIGQFTIKGIYGGGGNTKVFNLDDIKIKFERNNQQIALTNLKLVRDLNANGLRDDGDIEMATSTGIEANYADFVVPVANRSVTVNALHHFIVVLDAAYIGDPVPANATFRGGIENSASLIVSDAGNATVKEGNVSFASFMMEPSQNFFIFTKGKNDPAVKPDQQSKGDIPLMQIRAAAPGAANGIKRIQVRAASGSVRFGEGLSNLSFWLDTDSDGIGDERLPVQSDYETGVSSVQYTFPTEISFSAGETKHLVITGALSLKEGEKAQLEIAKGQVQLAGTASIAELPLRSREFNRSCDQLDPTCNGTIPDDDDPIDEEEESGCGCSLVY